MKVLVSDNLGQIGIDMFEQAEGITVDVKTGLPPEELKSIIGDYDAMVAARRDAETPSWVDSPGQVLQLHSETGFHDKPINAARAVLYSLMPAGSVLFWMGGLLHGAGANTSRVCTPTRATSRPPKRVLISRKAWTSGSPWGRKAMMSSAWATERAWSRAAPTRPRLTSTTARQTRRLTRWRPSQAKGEPGPGGAGSELVLHGP